MHSPIEQEINTNNKISSPEIGNNPILRNIKNAENIETQLETQHLQKQLSNLKKISLKEFIRFITFFILYFVIIGMQIPVFEIHSQNASMISSVLMSDEQPDILVTAKSFQTYDIFEKFILAVIDQISVPKYYYITSPVTGETVKYEVMSSITPVTNVRIRQKRAKLIPGTFEWESPIQYDRSTYGTDTNFTYDPSIGGFAIYPSYFRHELSDLWGYPLAYEAELEYSNFVFSGFYDEKTFQVSMDVSVVNTVSELLTYVEVNYVFLPTGLIKKNIFLNTVLFDYYGNTMGKARFALEIIYLILFFYYVLSKTSELYFEVKKAAVYESKVDRKNLAMLARCLMGAKTL